MAALTLSKADYTAGYTHVVKKFRSTHSMVEIGAAWTKGASKHGGQVSHRAKVSKASRGPTSVNYQTFARRFAIEWRRTHEKGPSPRTIGDAWTEYRTQWSNKEHAGKGTWREFVATHKGSTKVLRAKWFATTGKPVPAAILAQEAGNEKPTLKRTKTKAPKAKTVKPRTRTRTRNTNPKNQKARGTRTLVAVATA